MAQTIGPKTSLASWLNRCEIQPITRLTGQDLNNPLEVKFWGMYLSLDLPSLDADIDYRVVQGDRLDLIAEIYYGARDLRWVIADKNNLDDPSVELYEGRIIIIPSPTYVRRNVVGTIAR